MSPYKIGVLYGDGIGPEIVDSTVEIVNAACRRLELNVLEFQNLPIGWEAIDKLGHPVPSSTKEALAELDGWIMGPHDSASYPDKFKEIRNPSGELRHSFDLYANIRPSKSIPGVKGLVENANLVIYRENTEGFYPDRNMYSGVGEWKITPDVAVSTGVFTRKAITRIAKAAFEAAISRRKKVTIVHKANVIRLGTGMFKDICLEVAKDYPDVQVDDYHIDAMTAHLVRNIHQFDVIVTENMFGDILSDLAGELAGSLGLAPSINTNSQQVMAQAAHGSAPDIAGQNKANPVGIILSTVMLLQWLGDKHKDDKLIEIANLIEQSIYTVMGKGIKTVDLNGKETTTSFTKAVMNKIQQQK
ncbi:isocitrate/isopropylmalate dehydrogenase family protein [Bacilli bacterium]|uniref:isocitrate/isopropylmalate dehydrogenase family protein n=1 Tax=Oceanobacillus caeni TaxID=405946 RepID=UPI0006228E4B|nr:3-isopropylmalate dehydrogenase [Bacilli bacterium VT-13-104]PZD88703.1 isocitrate/isopropylmalate dehydrogenase family protein [Bacilli bacterium]PZD89995.1 isocitrate/isopropylmalate dehydrogenase family protein [Bacilli bacterium]PZD91929.1 isocitrate/isopropylmalate dehydrogenase family protein [Bacilli bacterium]RCO06871.1 isocitrate/isopropylmalate dehydrogenase family protein [Bacilli bacterium]